ncbi:hypothetical protein HDU96_000317 [Phlyctochytrium bullatum]|nr:hypothetical protein HDU96_000317 [Phlyctochytrium bullatum]
MPDPEAPPAATPLAHRPLSARLKEVFVNYLPLAVITFGGPQAHIALLFDLFVTRRRWLSEHMFAELFAMANAMPGPASTQLAFVLALVRGGVACGVLAFLIWSVPGGLVMTFLGYGVGRLGAAGIPVWVKKIQNGLAAVAVALVALAAFKLGSKILADNTARVLAILAASFCINYTDVIWVIPVMMVVGGVVTTLEAEVWPGVRDKLGWGDKAKEEKKDEAKVVPTATPAAEEQTPQQNGDAELRKRANAGASDAAKDDEAATAAVVPAETPSATTTVASVATPAPAPAEKEPELDLYFTYSVRTGLLTILLSLTLLGVAVALRTVPTIPRPLQILGTFFFVGHIIFGGGPVVVPLLYSYVVANGWLTDTEFLIGLAIINAMPGPNFNFAAYCGALALRDNVGTSVAGGALAWVGIFAPGLLLKAGVLPVWKNYRGLPKVKVAFKGFNSVAVGLVFAATYILFQKAITEGSFGPSLGQYPFYMAVTGCAFVMVEFLKVPAPLVVVLGGVVGAIEWAVSKDR